MSKRLASFLSLVILWSSQVVAFDKKQLLKIYDSFEHKNCQLKVFKLDKENSYLKKTLTEKILERDFKHQFISSGSELRKDDLYLVVKVLYGKEKAYRDCTIETKLYKADNNYRTSSSDKAMFSRKVTRSFPRVTFKGKERCKKSLKDTFLNIKFCIIPKRD